MMIRENTIYYSVDPLYQWLLLGKTSLMIPQAHPKHGATQAAAGVGGTSLHYGYIAEIHTRGMNQDIFSKTSLPKMH